MNGGQAAFVKPRFATFRQSRIFFTRSGFIYLSFLIALSALAIARSRSR